MKTICAELVLVFYMQTTLRIVFLPHKMLKKCANIASSWALFVEICSTLKLNLDAKGAHL